MSFGEAASIRVQAASLSEEDVSSVVLGASFDSASGRVLPSILARPLPRARSTAFSKESASSFSMKLLDARESESENIGVAGSLEGKIAGLARARVSGSYDRLTHSGKASASLNISVSVTDHVEAVEEPDKVQFAGGVRAGDGEEFGSKYGDSFISAVTWGGSLEARLTLEESQSGEEENLDFEGKIEAQFGPIEAQGSGSLKEKLEAATANRALDIDVVQLGGKATLTPQDVDLLAGRVSSFPEEVLSGEPEASVIVEFTIHRYDRVERFDERLTRETSGQSITRGGLVGGAMDIFVSDLQQLLGQYEMGKFNLSEELPDAVRSGDVPRSQRCASLYKRLVEESLRARLLLSQAAVLPREMEASMGELIDELEPPGLILARSQGT